VHQLVFDSVYAGWDPAQGPPPAWRPTPDVVERSNITAFCRKAGHRSFDELRTWSCRDPGKFWGRVVETLGIRFRRAPSAVLDDSAGAENARWLPGARLNVADSCFAAPGDRVAVVSGSEDGPLRQTTYGQLDRLSSRVAASLRSIGLAPGDAVGVVMPMTVLSVATYLGIVKAGCVVVSIAESFTAREITTRLRIAGAGVVFTQDSRPGAGKGDSLYQKVVAAGAQRVVLLPAGGEDSPAASAGLRPEDLLWNRFLVDDNGFEPVERSGDDDANILFSSGTTGEPKAIPWTHTTPIKCAMDGHLHHDIREGDVVVWPSSLGWMMGPWLIFATLANGATMGLFEGSPASRPFCRFVQDAGVTMLGLVPSIVRAWRAMDLPQGLDWSRIRAFSSTGEPSSPGDYLYLMSLAGYRPVIEYCGGTEIGGGYITGTVVQPASPSTFSTPALGMAIYILDDAGRPSEQGELFLVPPSIGLSGRLVNHNHHDVYFKDVPPGPGGETLRRHGDEMRALAGGYYRACGRADDTMNLGGVKVSSAEIEGAVAGAAGVSETAAIAVSPPGGGPGRLVIYAVPEAGATPDRFKLRMAMQRAISTGLNPLFKVDDVVVVDALPRTASNKVMRRVLRNRYETRATRG
jgi:acetyl-CoA synthetase